MEFSLLGPISVATGSGELALGPAKRRSVLALLLLRPNTTVPLEQLIDALWEEEPPEHARTVVQGHVSRLRATLAEAGAEAYGVGLATHGSAYLLRLPEELIDAHRFGELVALARPENAPGDAVPLLREALALWRGPALTGTVPSPPFAAAAHALEERRLTAVEALARAYSAMDDHEQAASVLYSAAVTHPLREGLIAALIRTLFRTGRQSDAIEWFHRTRRLLDEELGVPPGERLTAAYEEILRAERGSGRRGGAQGGAGTVVPGTRPASTDGGRSASTGNGGRATSPNAGQAARANGGQAARANDGRAAAEVPAPRGDGGPRPGGDAPTGGGGPPPGPPHRGAGPHRPPPRDP
ncbi:BTAD domain-containing putative transcriptional regulator, partial [Streptomyces sp. NPDC003077]|uniref:AfsR/SARP family transcriptional regulator n=1 Tax=Streptomyces sp. NPDC003077 TaxID=3154443 RepID=UPI0033A69463